LLEYANANDVGIQTIKMLARGGWGAQEKDCTTWYDPHREQADIDTALNWLFSQAIHTAPSTGEITLIPAILDAAESYTSLDENAQEEVLAAQRAPVQEPRLAIPA
ncbi:MAG TPA: hypothetical protein QGG37_11620, partial [Chloroflexota bacterium]|nr:hypothetical protein [Chloroflexota bacterium]